MTNKPKEILMILQPRAIPEAIESLNKLDIEKVWFRGYTEMELETVLNDFIKDTDYDYYWIIADDVIVDNKPLEVLRPKLYEGEVVTGYCNLYQGSDYVNLSFEQTDKLYDDSEIYHLYQMIKYSPLESIIEKEHWLKNQKYYTFLESNRNKGLNFWKHRVQELQLYPPHLMSQEQVNEMGNNYFQTYFAGWSFTGMSRDFWLNYPFQCSWKGMATDAQFAMRFFEGECGEKIFTHKDSWFLHLKEDSPTGTFLNRNWLVGEEEPVVHFGDGKLLRDEIETEQIYPKRD